MVDRNFNQMRNHKPNNFAYNNSHQGINANPVPYQRGRININMNPVSEQERMEAKEALASLKMKTNSQRVQQGSNYVGQPYIAPNKFLSPQEMESKNGGGRSGFESRGGIDIGGKNGFEGRGGMDIGKRNGFEGRGGMDIGGYANIQPRQPQKYQPQPQPQPQQSNPYPQATQMRSKINTTNSTRPRMNINQGMGGNEMEDNRPLDRKGDMNNYDVNKDVELEQCPDCEKMFAPQSLAKHITVCKKVFGRKRKAFDSKKNRIVDPEQAMLIKQGEREAQKREKLEANKKKSNVPKWKRQSEELRKIAQLNKEYEGNNNNTDVQVISGKGGNNKGEIGKSMGMGMKAGGGNQIQQKPQQFIPSTINEDYVFCKFCNRNYNEQAYEKHAPGCERRFKERQMKNGTSSLQPKPNYQSKPFGKK